MNIWRTIEITFMNLTCHAFRAFLAALGVVLGVGAVVGMMGISEGAKQESLENIQSMGINNIVISSVKPRLNSSNTSDENQEKFIEYGVTNRDIMHIEKVFENIADLVAIRKYDKTIYVNGKRQELEIIGTKPGFLTISNSQLCDKRGRWLTDFDCEHRNPVCVLGKYAARKMFSFNDPLGEQISVDGAVFTVVGIMENSHGINLGGSFDLNKIIYIPIDSGNAFYGEVLPVLNRGDSNMTQKIDAHYLYIQVEDTKQLVNTAARLKSYMKTTHEVKDYSFYIPSELLKQEEATQKVFTIVMGSIAAISLLVGGIGIMNIMLANIFERTKEIGTRRALGAKKRDILIQFMVESILLTGIGGALGLGLGFSIAWLVEYYAGMRTIVTASSVIISLSVSVMTGVIFGTYPAWKAANLDPIVALRRD